MNTKPNFFRSTLKALSILTLMVMVFAQAVSPVSAQAAVPIEESITVEKNGESVTVKVLKGFDPNEYGGDDSGCTYSGSEPEKIHIGEVVGSPNEACLQVIEWSLKNGDSTIVAGTYVLAPHEWFYIPMAVAGVNDEVRVVGTLYRMPKGWNAHMMAVYYAIDRDARDGTHSYIGLSPTDPWVLAQIDSLSGRAPLATAISTVVPSTPLPTSTPAATATPPATLASPVYDDAYARAVCGDRQVDSLDPVSGKVECQRASTLNLGSMIPWALIAFLVILLLIAIFFSRPATAEASASTVRPSRKTAKPVKKTTKK